MAEIEIVESVKMFSTEPQRLGKLDFWVTYTVNGARSYMLTLPIEEIVKPDGVIDFEKVKAAIIKQEKERTQLIGRKFIT